MNSKPLAQGQLCYKVKLIHQDGTAVHPVAIRNRDTGRIAFTLARPGTNSHHRDAAMEHDDEDMVVRGIVQQRMSVRCQAVDGSHKALYSPDGRNIVRVEVADTTGSGP